MTFKSSWYIFAASCVLVTAAPARAEIVLLNSGRTVTIKSHRVDGDNVILTMRSDGEITVNKSLIEKIVADEVPEPEAESEPQHAVEPETPASENPPISFRTTPYDEIITSLAQAHGVNPILVRALIQVESGYRPKARSIKGAMGLMQLMPSTARQYNVRNPYDPTANIAAGVKHLKALLDRWGGAVELALAAYNAGEGAVKRFNGMPPYRETRDYVARILSLAGIE